MGRVPGASDNSFSAQRIQKRVLGAPVPVQLDLACLWRVFDRNSELFGGRFVSKNAPKMRQIWFLEFWDRILIGKPLEIKKKFCQNQTFMSKTGVEGTPDTGSDNLQSENTPKTPQIIPTANNFEIRWFSDKFHKSILETRQRCARLMFLPETTPKTSVSESCQ